MVSKKRQNYCGFDGFHSPVVPKAPRSIRRNPHKKSSTGNEICAFELLAAVAGKLLQESEGSASSNSPEHKDQINIPKDNVKKEPLEEVKLKPDLDHGCCAESQFIPEIPSNNLELKLEPPLKDSILSDNDSGLEHASIVTTQDFFTNVKLEGSDSKNIAVNTPSKSEGDFMDSNIPKIIEKETGKKSYSSVHEHEDLLHLPFYSDSVPLRRRGRNVKKIGNVRDDGENYSFSCTTKLKAFRLQSRGGYGYRRMRKMFSSKYWKTVPKLKDYEVSNTKKRKLFQHTSKPEYVDEASSESISNLPDRHPSKRVKFSIKSFKVPELYLEMQETSTVGSLKRTVMEALTAILQSELHVGVLFQGKKVRDDNITLQQTGISLNSDTLGFMLEPTLPEPSVQKQAPLSPQSDNNHQPLPTDSPLTDPGFSNSSIGVNPMPETNQIEKTEEEEIAVDTNTITNTITNTNTNTNSNTKAIVPITEAVPLNQKLTKRSELSQRRTRRPFSVSEVEALVEAVETLGTGRWRDVKIRAFDDANHRTYVDLKDKWKTLVHTASISPQQRRGEPVPQNLLDRVLGAHGFWSTHQSKQLVKVETPVKVCLDLEG